MIFARSRLRLCQNAPGGYSRRYNIVTGTSDRGDRYELRGLPARRSHRSYSAFQCSHAGLEYALKHRWTASEGIVRVEECTSHHCGVCHARVCISDCFSSEEIGGMLRCDRILSDRHNGVRMDVAYLTIIEYEACAGVDGRRSCVRRRIRDLPSMQLECLEFGFPGTFRTPAEGSED